MLLNTIHFPAGGHCDLLLDEAHDWLHARWSGIIDNKEAIAGANAYLDKVRALPLAYPRLLNDNYALHGYWFDSLQWLAHAWLPQAAQLGLRWVAHVVQADTHTDVLTLHLPAHVVGKIELQVFDNVPDAQEWLGACR